MTHAWEHADHFELYDDVLPTLADLRARGLRLGLLSNTARDLDALRRRTTPSTSTRCSPRASHGKTKPHEAIFRRMLELLDVAAGEAAMVGDTLEDDIEGARAVGMRAVLLDREGRHPGRCRRGSTTFARCRSHSASTKLSSWVGSSGCSLRSRLRVGEVLTPGLFFLGPVALAAGAAALASLLGAGTLGSLIVFIVCSVASLAILRPIARSHLRLPALSRTGTDAMIGRKGDRHPAGRPPRRPRPDRRRGVERARISRRPGAARGHARSTSSRSRASPLSSPNRRSPWLC